MKSFIKNKLNILKTFLVGGVEKKQNETLILLGGLHCSRVRALQNIQSLNEAEFKVFSQWGEDGIIQYLISNVEIDDNRTFVEFGVEDYNEANTRFLLINDNWRGLIMDGSEENIRKVQHDPIYWRYHLTAVAKFITKDNINGLIAEYIGAGDLGILSIDVDGNDYWIWKAIDCVFPRIVICEYNSVFGAKHAVTVPYDEGFVRTDAHYSNLYWGASLAAFCHLAREKGYDFVGSNSTGCNAFFVRKDLSTKLRKFTPEEGYVESKYRESRDKDYSMTFVAGKDRIKVIQDKLIFDVTTGKVLPIRELSLDKV